ncbi:deoxyribonuclease YjjV [Enterovibrio norvegicus]|uniref:TatD family hydrolase n=1 Tax=Enterovibrio norvegicus TaxID=188144 RepID=UPI000C82F4A0|nr:TatD family hydrolase [Enterovibrio norvegicus]MCC4799655.1 TatD family hydrolase [Enterovibrio norvegicus]PMI33972.1 deoxyribonuclease YjjV [Enterovibrio norvegicus]PMI36013.1 deoxyribonuclease YjjV [Enterovibrio norvegicus]PMN53679.1 deoxyribonuclease YjjV [Enterovibrio norvegicus]TKF04235.1 TatD family deoxyribonuclease [Enterovibrio norvegicus]
MIDTHCHFDFPPFSDDPAYWVSRSVDAGLTSIIVPSVTADRWPSVRSLSTSHSPLYFAVGLHPVWSSSHKEGDIAALEAFLATSPEKCVAVGECGLDFMIDDANPQAQIDILKQQLTLAETFQLPVILHCRKAHNELLQVLNGFPNVKGVLHAFSGSKEMGLNYIKRGFLLGIGGTITYERANKTRNAIVELPLSAMVLETDAPDMPVSGYQGEPNLPERLLLIAEALSGLKGSNVGEVIQATSQNARRLFSLNSEISSFA